VALFKVENFPPFHLAFRRRHKEATVAIDISSFKERQIGIFGKSIPIGQFFAEKKGSDFKTEKEFLKYVDSVKHDAHAFMREPSTPESRSLMLDEVDEKIIERLPPAEQVAYAEKMLVKTTDRSNRILKLVENCIVGTDMLDSGKPMTVEAFRDLCTSNTHLMSYLSEQWMADSANFPKQSDENSKSSQE